MLIKKQSKYIGYSPIYDYIYRPTEFNNICLYDWIRRYKKVKVYKNKKSTNNIDELDAFCIDNDNQTDLESIKLDFTE